MSLDEKIRNGLETLVEPVVVDEVLSAVDARNAGRPGRRWPKLVGVAAAAIAVAALGVSQLGEDSPRQVTAGPAPSDVAGPSTDDLPVDGEREPSVADTPITELPPSAGSGDPSLAELDYGDGVLRIPRPKIEGLDDPQLFSMIPSTIAADTTVRWDLPTELAGAFQGSVVVTVLPSDLVDESGGSGSSGIERARAMIASADLETRELQIAGQPALFVPTADVTPGQSLGRPDRISSLLTWVQADGSVVQLISDLMTEAELVAYAELIVDQAS